VALVAQHYSPAACRTSSLRSPTLSATTSQRQMPMDGARSGCRTTWIGAYPASRAAK
jgi:hypothetical protein